MIKPDYKPHPVPEWSDIIAAKNAEIKRLQAEIVELRRMIDLNAGRG